MNFGDIARLFFLTIAAISIATYSLGAFDIFHRFNIDSGIDNKKEKNFKKVPRFWRIELHLHVFLGVVIGWIAMWLLIDKHLNLFSGNPNFTQLGVADLILFLIGFIGINGRLPTIAHTIQDWFNPIAIIKALKDK